MAATSRRNFLHRTLGLMASGAITRAGWAAGSSAKIPESGNATGLRRRSFSFLHTYEATGRYWKGIEKAGLIRPATGLRLVHSPFGDDNARRFNAVARLDGPLFKILQKRLCPFIVDRVAGGAPYHVYEFDQQLIATYAALLRHKFMGGQVHEVLSNLNNDWNRLKKANPRLQTQPVEPAAVREYFTWAEANRWLEYGSLEQYAGRTRPQSPLAWWKEYQTGAQRQARRFGGHFSYCEGSHYGELAWHVFYKLDAAFCLAEVGPWASTQTQFAIASLRGAAKAANRPWGVFFAPWGPGGCTSFVPEKDWSWQCPRQFLDASGWPVGPKAGPSSALQRRSFFHAYLSGASTLHEEWGAECNLTDWEAGTISSYGRVTRDLLDFQDAHPDVGEPFTPIALVLDASIPPPETPVWEEFKKGLFAYSEADRGNAKRRGAPGQEVNCYPPCALPEIFDIVPSDAPANLWASYKRVIRFAPASRPEGAGSSSGKELFDMLAAAVREHSPFERSTHLSMQINHRESDGAWILGLHNPWGARRGDVEQTGSILDEGCAIRDILKAKFSIRSARVLHAWPESSTMSLSADELAVNVGPGGTLIIEVLPRL